MFLEVLHVGGNLTTQLLDQINQVINVNVINFDIVLSLSILITKYARINQ